MFPADAPAPTTDEIYAASRLKWRKLGITAAADLAEPLLEAIAYVVTLTGRYFQDTQAPVAVDDAASLVATPNLVPLARKAVRMRTEQIVKQEQPGYVDTATDDLIQSFSAGPYSETRHDPTRRGETKMLNPWPNLNALLWALMTDGRYEFWLAYTTGVHGPAFEVEEVDWSLVGRNLYGLYGYPAAGAAAYPPFVIGN